MNVRATSSKFVPAAAVTARLEDRGAVAVGGSDAEGFLQGLITNDVVGLAPGTGRYAALLTPQGKILFDFLITRDAHGGFLLDCVRSAAPDLAKRLSFYRLRAKVAVEDRSGVMSVVAAWGTGAAEADFGTEAIGFADPRHPDLGWRFFVPAGAQADPIQREAYERHRIVLGVPSAGVDFAYGDTFPHEANLDRLLGVDFQKGCYVGQEVVARVEHRGLARKRVVPVYFDAAPPAPGTEVFAGETSIGHMGSGVDGRGLAMLRLDRAEQARITKTPLIAGTTPVQLEPR